MMSVIKSAFKTVKKRFSTPPPTSNGDHTNLPNGRTSQSIATPRQSSFERARTTELKRLHDEKTKAAEFEKAMQLDPPEIQERYGKLPLVEVEEREEKAAFSITSLDDSYIGKEVTLRARIHHNRAVSAKLTFMVLRQQIQTLQAVLAVREGVVSETFVRWAEHLRSETVVLITGTIQSPKEPIKGATIHNLEILVDSLHVVSQLTQPLPFNVYDDELSKNPDDHVHNMSDRTRLEHRLLDLRSPATQSIFRINAAVCSIFRSHLDAQGFMEIHTPKLQGGATESGSSVFPVKYFGRTAFLAQSPQLAKQMAMSADFGKVYEVGPIFRAENSNTHRHMTEFTGLDLEMTIQQHYHEALRVIDGTLKAIFKGVYERCRTEVDLLKKTYPCDDLVWKEETLVLAFKDGIKLLRESGWTDENGEPPSETEDLSTRDEIELGRLIKDKYQTDYYILDKFPSSARPFYAMPDPTDKNFTNSFDIFVRGQEILSGGQRIHDATMLEERMQELGIQPLGALKEYVQGFRWGCPPHAGGGIGLERIIMLLLNLGNIRHASMFPRDPKSLPDDKVPPVLRHHDADTLHPPWEFLETLPATFEEIEQHMPLAKLIANYGDASNTSWLDDRYETWRHHRTGAAIGYVKSHGYAIVVGDPLCDSNQFSEVIHDFLPWIKHSVGKPIWMLVSRSVEGILGGDMDWKSISCVAEDRTDPLDNKARNDPAISRKLRHAQKAGVKLSVTKQGEAPSEEVKQKIDKRMEDWMAQRKSKGKQIHLTDLAPWKDVEHRIYVVGATPDGTVHSLVILTQLSPEHGYQVKWALDFPDAPSGSIEYAVMTALDVAAENGAKSVTFGAGARSSLSVEHGFENQKIVVKTLEHSYQTIATELKLMNKSEFRAKMGAYEDPVYVCFGKGTLGPKGIRAIMSFFEDGDD